MSTFWPGVTSARSTSACHAVRATRGSDAACAIVSPAGLGARSSSLTEMSPAKVPIRPVSGRAQTSSPGANRCTPGPALSATPARSLPGTNGGL